MNQNTIANKLDANKHLKINLLLQIKFINN